MLRERVFLFAGIIAFTSVALACSDENRITSAEAESPLTPTSPENVLQNIAYAYRTLDFELYRDQFDPNLEIIFPPEIQAFMEDPSSEWDMMATENLFETADEIKFEVLFEPPTASTIDGYAGDAGFVEIKAHSILLDVKSSFTDGDNWVATDEEAILVMKKDTSMNPETFKVVYMQYLGAPDDASGQ